MDLLQMMIQEGASNTLFIFFHMYVPYLLLTAPVRVALTALKKCWYVPYLPSPWNMICVMEIGWLSGSISDCLTTLNSQKPFL